MTSLDAAIERYAPYDGPHDDDTVADAAVGVAALVRYLNNATGPGNSRTTLGYANAVHQVLRGVGDAVHGLDQLFDQLATAIEHQAADPTLYDDRRDRPGSDTAHNAAGALTEAREVAAELARAIDTVRSYSYHLGNDD